MDKDVKVTIVLKCGHVKYNYLPKGEAVRYIEDITKIMCKRELFTCCSGKMVINAGEIALVHTDD